MLTHTNVHRHSQAHVCLISTAVIMHYVYNMSPVPLTGVKMTRTRACLRRSGTCWLDEQYWKLSNIITDEM